MNTTRPFLQFAIPTWNRVKEVEICIRSIAEQIVASGREDISILLSDDKSDDDTPEKIRELQKEFPFIAYRCNEERFDYSEAFLSMFRACDAEWVWTFGDDDRLEPNGLATILKLLTDTDIDFVHISEKSRYSGTNGLYKGDLLTLCNTFGWLEMTGFITCNVVRGDVLNKCGHSPNFRRYSKCAFVQSCVLLEVLKDSKCALWDVPLVSTQNEQQTQECIDRWEKDKIGERYLWIVDALDLMFEAGILKKKLERAFFRYQQLNFWDRHIVYFCHDYFSNGIITQSYRWDALARLLRFLADETYATEILMQLEAARNTINLHAYMSVNLNSLMDGTKELIAKHSEFRYPWGYVIPKEMLEDNKKLRISVDA